jgi:hypothetical protein
MYTEKTKVIFRTFKDIDEVIAFFPEELGTNDLNTCNSYMHIGQHGSAYTHITSKTRPSTKEEIKPIYDELKSIGYNLVVKKKFLYSHFITRRDKLNAIGRK